MRGVPVSDHLRACPAIPAGARQIPGAMQGEHTHCVGAVHASQVRDLVAPRAHGFLADDAVVGIGSDRGTHYSLSWGLLVALRSRLSSVAQIGQYGPELPAL